MFKTHQGFKTKCFLQNEYFELHNKYFVNILNKLMNEILHMGEECQSVKKIAFSENNSGYEVD